MKLASYAIEIQRAKELGLENVVEQLQKNLQKEIKLISTTSGGAMVGGRINEAK